MMVDIRRTLLLGKLREALDRLIAQKATGRMILSNKRILGEIFMMSGRLLYVVDQVHRVRRWQRAIQKHCPHWDVPPLWLDEQPWEYALLVQGISKKQLTLEQVKAVISQVAQECLIELRYQSQIKASWQPQERTKSVLCHCLTLSSAEIHPLLSKVDHTYHHWSDSGREKIQPSLASFCNHKVSSEVLPIAQAFLLGKLTAWEIVVAANQPMIGVNQSLFPWVEKGSIELKVVNNLRYKAVQKAMKTPSSTQQPQATVSPLSSSDHKALIACIDDSAVVIRNLKKILEPAGYQTLSIREPMAGFAELIKYQPNLILLDLNMPNANGYSVCKFLRESCVFAQTPILILTSQDTVVNKARAKLVGATDFIPKPPKPEKLLHTIQFYLDGITVATSAPTGI
ncbi:MAG: response regulator [Microcystaceae cyanobacterium]